MLFMMPFLAGGGKRGRAGVPTARGVNKKEKMKVIREAIGMASLRLQALPGFVNSIDVIVGQGLLANAEMQRGNNVLLDMMRGKSAAVIADLQDNLTATNNVEKRMETIAEVIFERQYEELEEVEKQVERARELLSLYTDLMLTGFYSENEQIGGISWSRFNAMLRDLLVHLQNPPARAGAGRAMDM
jgi:hypothetical protein